MQVTIALETRFLQTPDGAVWSTGWLDADFWQRYLEVFDRVQVMARIAEVDAPQQSGIRADGPRISFVALPYYIGPWQFAARYPLLAQRVRRACCSSGAFILRVPGTIGTMAAQALVGLDRPFGVEVIGDPSEVFVSSGVRSLLNPVWRRRFVSALRVQCARACAVSYVSKIPLLERYPPSGNAFVTSYSSIGLRDQAFVPTPRTYSDSPRPFRLVTVGTLEQLYKGPDVLLQALADLAEHAGDLDVQLTFVGDGRYRAELSQSAGRLGLAGRVRFAGRLPPGDPVRHELDRADLFVLPSRTEGLPRAMIEAMARGLPCVGTGVGGIPELLDPAEIVPAGDTRALARAIDQLARDPKRLGRLSTANLEKARSYHADVLQPRRRAFYQAVRERTPA